MEFLDGPNLAKWIHEKPRPWREILPVFLQAGAGLQAAHTAGFVHRDFKPKSECPPQTPPLPPSGRILADRGDLRGAVCRVMPRHAASLATDWQRPARRVGVDLRDPDTASKPHPNCGSWAARSQTGVLSGSGAPRIPSRRRGASPSWRRAGDERLNLFHRTS